MFCSTSSGNAWSWWLMVGAVFGGAVELVGVPRTPQAVGCLQLDRIPKNRIVVPYWRARCPW